MTDAGADSEVAGALNLRDVGGLPARGGVTRRRTLFRSGSLAGLAEEGRRSLRDLGIRRIVDLREDEEIGREPSRLIARDVETVRIPLFLGSTASFFVDDVSLPEMYRGLAFGAPDRIVAVARAVLGARPVLVHCTVGKDRTGIAVAILLSAVDVERGAVVADFTRTEQALPAERNARVLAHLRALHPDARHLDDLVTRAPAPVLGALLDELDERFGSTAGYLRAHGFADDELVGLRRALVVDDADA